MSHMWRSCEGSNGSIESHASGVTHRFRRGRPPARGPATPTTPLWPRPPSLPVSLRVPSPSSYRRTRAVAAILRGRRRAQLAARTRQSRLSSLSPDRGRGAGAAGGRSVASLGVKWFTQRATTAQYAPAPCGPLEGTLSAALRTSGELVQPNEANGAGSAWIGARTYSSKAEEQLATARPGRIAACQATVSSTTDRARGSG
jgi:hypothetical protein